MPRATPLIINTALLLISIATIAVSSVALPHEDRHSISLLFNHGIASRIWVIFKVAPGASSATLYAALAAGVVGTVTTLAQYFTISGPDSSKGRLWGAVVASALAVVAGIVAFAWSCVATYTSTKIYGGPFPDNTQTNVVGLDGKYSMESWRCQSLRYLGPGYGLGSARTACYTGVSKC